jgi:hypothetical protein
MNICITTEPPTLRGVVVSGILNRVSLPMALVKVLIYSER